MNVRIGVVGVGYLGEAHVKNLRCLDGVEVIGAADTNEERCRKVASEHGIAAYRDYHALIPLVDAVTIVVPTCLHHSVARDFLREGIPVLIEKPMTADLAQADELLALADRHGAIIQVGHVEQFNPLTAQILVPRGVPRFVEAHRAGPYTFRSTDIGVVLDLMIHDLDLIQWLVGEPPVEVQSTCWSQFGGHEDVASARLAFRNGTVAHLTASRASQSPRRDWTVWWPGGHAQLDFMRKTCTTVDASDAFWRDRARFAHPSPAEIAELQSKMTGHYFAVRQHDCSRDTAALSRELADFVDNVRTGHSPSVPGSRGRAAVALALRVRQAAEQTALRIAA